MSLEAFKRTHLSQRKLENALEVVQEFKGLETSVDLASTPAVVWTMVEYLESLLVQMTAPGSDLS